MKSLKKIVLAGFSLLFLLSFVNGAKKKKEYQ